MHEIFPEVSIDSPTDVHGWRLGSVNIKENKLQFSKNKTTSIVFKVGLTVRRTGINKLEVDAPIYLIKGESSGYSPLDLQNLVGWIVARINAWQEKLRAPDECLVTPLRSGVIQLNYKTRCDYRCSFCDAHGTDDRIPSSPIPRIIDNLDGRWKKARPRKVAISCNEPFKDPELFVLLDYLSQRGVDEIEIITTGLPLQEKKLAAMLSKYPAVSIDLPLYGATSGTHDLITGSTGAFKRVITSIENLAALNIAFKIHTVALIQNIKELDRLSEVVFQNHGLNLYVRHLIPPSSDQRLFRSLMPEYKEIRALQSPSLVLIEFPPCTVPDHSVEHSPLKKVRSFTAKVRIAACHGCAQWKVCKGIYDMYLKTYGSPS